MNQDKKLKEYCEKMLLDFEIEDGILQLEDKEYAIVDGEEILFNEEFDFCPTSEYEVDGFVYEFNGRWYTQDVSEEVELKKLIYIGKAQQRIPTPSFLGIRSGYELLNGMGLYKDWVKKAKFLGIKSLGICEKNTLSGALDFQSECQSNGIKSIIGLTVPIKCESGSYDIKLYAKNFQGWLNLLKFNTEIKVNQQIAISLEFLNDNIGDLFSIADPKSMPFEEVPSCIDFYQLETVNFLNEEKDNAFIDNLEKYLLSNKEPISITDAFYLEQEDFVVREQLWAIGKLFDDKTNNQYFKNKDQYARELIAMFDGTDTSWIALYEKATANEKFLVENCNFKYDTDTRHLPRYIMTKEEAAEFETNEDLFLDLIKKGFKKKKIEDPQKYIDRLKIEIDVLKKGDMLDYFLTLHDHIRFAKSEGMLTGIGRGSAGGSLVAYLLGIIQIDPIEFDLLFERFLNSGRTGEYQDRPLYIVELEDGSTVKLAEGALVRIRRGNTETIVFIHDLEEGDEILKY